MITPETLQLLMKEVESEDPIDFADLPFEEDAHVRLSPTISVKSPNA